MPTRFNPRTRRACDNFVGKQYVSKMVSIHARVERATTVYYFQKSTGFVSIHARVERATRRDSRSQSRRIVSIHARVERATNTTRRDSRPKAFQSTHA